MTKKIVNLYTYSRVSSATQIGNSSLDSQFLQMERTVSKWSQNQADIQYNLIECKAINESATGVDGQNALLDLIREASKDRNGAILVSFVDRLSRHVSKGCEAEKKGLRIYCCDWSAENGVKPIPYSILYDLITQASKEPIKTYKRTCTPLAWAWENPNKFLYQRGKYRTEIDINGNVVQVPKIGKREAEISAENRWKKKFGDTDTAKQDRRTYEKIEEFRKQGKTFLWIGQWLDSNIELYPINTTLRKDANYLSKHNLLSAKEKRKMLMSGEIAVWEITELRESEKLAKNKELQSRGWVTAKEKTDRKGNKKVMYEANRVYALYRNFSDLYAIKQGEKLEIENGILSFGNDTKLNKYINEIIQGANKREIARLLNAKGVKTKNGGTFYAQTVSRLQKEIKEYQHPQMQQSCK